jgi:hypothetical protein
LDNVAAVPQALTFLHSCLLCSKQASLFVRLHLVVVKRLVDVTTGVHVNGSSSVGVLRAVRPPFKVRGPMCCLP